MLRYLGCVLGLFSLVLGVSGPAVAASELRHYTITSPVLQRDLAMLVYLPDGYQVTDQKYPVLYLFHGVGDTEKAWIEFANIKSRVDKLIGTGAIPPSIVVMPGCQGCWWVDSASARMETAFWSDLVPQVESRYRAEGTREGRMLAGISAGGHGAVRLAMKHPERVAAVAALSPAIYHDAPHAGSNSRQNEAFRGADGRFDQNAWTAHNYTSVIKDYAARNQSVSFYLVSGDEDRLGIAFETAVLFNALRTSQPDAAKLRIVAGDHNWDCWTAALDEALRSVYRAAVVARAGAGQTETLAVEADPGFLFPEMGLT